ncbi:hypothetical protein B0H19DRAFT_1084025 [Mycena capillaripes]|nr:hypothetical protein B0H19DRAFT_1084025 [Mycena capillaripes]
MSPKSHMALCVLCKAAGFSLLFLVLVFLSTSQCPVMTDINTGGAPKGSEGVHRGGHALADDDLCKRRRCSERTGIKLCWGRGKPAKRSEAQQGRMLRNRVLGRKGASQEERRVLRHESEVPAGERGGGGEPEEAGRLPIDGLSKL